MQGMSSADTVPAIVPAGAGLLEVPLHPRAPPPGLPEPPAARPAPCRPGGRLQLPSGVPVRPGRDGRDRHEPRSSTRAAARAASSASPSCRSPRTSRAASWPCRRRTTRRCSTGASTSTRTSTLIRSSYPTGSTQQILTALIAAALGPRRAAGLPAAPRLGRPLRSAGAAQGPDPHGDLRLGGLEPRHRDRGPHARRAAGDAGPPELLPDPRDGGALRRLGVRRGRPDARLLPLPRAGQRQRRGGVHDGRGLPGRRPRPLCASGIPPLTNQAPLFNNGAHGSTGSLEAGQQIAGVPPDRRDDSAVLQRAV